MKEYIQFGDFEERFLSSDTYKDNFTHEGLRALFDYIEEYEAETGEETTFDMVALCCEYSEYPSAKEASDQYGRYYDIDDTNENIEKSAREWIDDRTTVIDVEGGGVIICNF